MLITATSQTRQLSKHADDDVTSVTNTASEFKFVHCCAKFFLLLLHLLSVPGKVFAHIILARIKPTLLSHRRPQQGDKQSKLTAIIQSRRLTLFGHIMRMDDNADAKRILLASPPADWRTQLGRPRIMWLSTVQRDLKQHQLALPEAADLAQNRPLWRMMLTYVVTQS